MMNDKPSNSRTRQNGFSLWSTIGLLGLVGILLFAGLHIAPVYLDNYTVKKVLASLDNNPDIITASEAEVQEMILKAFAINNIRDIPRNKVSIKGSHGNKIANVDYTREIPLFDNMNLVVSFKNTWTSKL